MQQETCTRIGIQFALKLFSLCLFASLFVVVCNTMEKKLHIDSFNNIHLMCTSTHPSNRRARKREFILSSFASFNAMLFCCSTFSLSWSVVYFYVAFYCTNKLSSHLCQRTAHRLTHIYMCVLYANERTLWHFILRK